jgi:cytochrome c oxidase subunit III
MSATARSGQGLPVFVTGPKSSMWWGIFLLMLIESTVFVGLISSYFYLFANASVWPPQGTDSPSLGIPLVYTVFLAVSGVVAVLGNRAIGNGDVARMRWFRLAGIACLVIFLVLKAYEYGNLPYRWDESAYTSILWLIAGFHSAHVATVLVKEIPIQVLAWKGFFTQERKAALEGATMYWVFVAAWWFPLFAVVYFFPNFV